MRVFSLLFFLSVPAALGAGTDTLKVRLDDFGLHLPLLEKLLIEKESTISAGGLVSEEIVAAAPGGERRARLVVTRGPKWEALRNLLESHLGSVRSQLLPKNPGSMALQKLACPISERRTGTSQALSLFADAQLRYGVCDASKGGYASLAIFLSCEEKKTVYEIYYYHPPTEAKSALRAMRTLACDDLGPAK